MENNVRVSIIKLFEQYIKYIFTGTFSILVDYVLLNTAMIFTGEKYYYIAIFIGLSGGLVVNYILSKLWVFKCYEKISKREVISFIISTSFGFGFTFLGVHYLFKVLHIDINISKAIVAFLVFIFNFLARKYFIFNQSKAKN